VEGDACLLLLTIGMALLVVMMGITGGDTWLLLLLLLPLDFLGTGGGGGIGGDACVGLFAMGGLGAFMALMISSASEVA
jgi:hypothetical protein